MFNHSVKIEVMVSFFHRAHYFLKARNPGKCLLIAHCIISFIVILDRFGMIFLMALFVSMVFDVLKATMRESESH